MSAHPLLPLCKKKFVFPFSPGLKRLIWRGGSFPDLTGSQDGSVQMWEWGLIQPVSTPRAPGAFAKVTRVRFSQHGNKFGVADGDGKLSLFQVGLSSSDSRSFFVSNACHFFSSSAARVDILNVSRFQSHQCHNKVTSDFVFLGSCSMVATAGHSSESKNVAIWDSLLPKKKAMIAGTLFYKKNFALKKDRSLNFYKFFSIYLPRSRRF